MARQCKQCKGFFVAMRVTLTTIAKKAGLSVATTCLALSGHKRVSLKTQARVRAISDALGYTRIGDGGGTMRGQQRTYGLVLLGAGHFPKSGSSIVTFLSQVASALSRRLEVIVIQDLEDKERVRSRLAECAKGLAGLFLSEYVDFETAGFMATMNLPCVVLGDLMGATGPSRPADEGGHAGRLNQVTHDTIGMGWAATAHLLEKGLAPVAFVAYEGCKGLYQDRWLTGWRNAHFDAGSAPDMSLVHLVRSGCFDARNLAGQLMDLPTRPRGFVFPDPELALPLLLAMERLHKPIPAAAVVLGGTRERVVQCGLDQCPSIEPDMESWARSAMAHMEMLVNGYVSWSETITCPLRFHAPAAAEKPSRRS